MTFEHSRLHNVRNSQARGQISANGWRFIAIEQLALLDIFFRCHSGTSFRCVFNNLSCFEITFLYHFEAISPEAEQHC
ncbi:hypothetical protein CEXT_410521, partial [Caerostris extrusa]